MQHAQDDFQGIVGTPKRVDDLEPSDILIQIDSVSVLFTLNGQQAVHFPASQRIYGDAKVIGHLLTSHELSRKLLLSHAIQDLLRQFNGLPRTAVF